MRTFAQFLEEKSLAEGYPGTKANPPDNAAWVSPETKAWRHPHALEIPKEPVRLSKKELNQLPPHLRNDQDVKDSGSGLMVRSGKRYKDLVGKKDR